LITNFLYFPGRFQIRRNWHICIKCCCESCNGRSFGCEWLQFVWLY